MKRANIVCTIVASLALAPAVFAQSILNNAKTQDILKQLTSQPRKTWISAGTIEATHREYGAAKITDTTEINAKISEAINAYQQNPQKRELTPESQKMALDAIPFNTQYRYANEYTMTSREIIQYDGERFHWEVTVSDRSDTVKPDADLAKNYAIRHFNRSWNDKRVFAWDGQKYTTYSASAKQAYMDAAGSLPRVVHGPLTAGLIPWGYEKFSYENLSAADVSITQDVSAKAASSVHMAITHPDGSTSELGLDPAKDYAVTSATLTTLDGFAVTYTLSGYSLVAGRWVPSSVAIERKNLSVDSRVATSESWTNIKVTSTSVPSLSSFGVPLELDATVEYASPAMASSALYINSYEADTDELLAERLAYGTAEGSRPQNCATAALQHVASTFGKTASHAALAQLVDESGSTNLYDLKRFAQGLGLYARVVKTDLAGLENLGAARAILHIPGTNHFVVVDRVGGQHVWLIDLSSKKFYYRRSVHFFPLEWTTGTALLLSDRPIANQFSEIPDTRLKDIGGGAAWSCNIQMQENDFIACDVIGDICQGAYAFYPERWACGSAPTGVCESQILLYSEETACVPDPIYICNFTGIWDYYYWYACR